MLPSSTHQRYLFYLLASMLVFAPLFRAGNSPIPLMLLQLLGLTVLLFVILDKEGLKFLPGSQLVAVLLVALLPLLFLIPVPLDFWWQLPGRDHYIDSLAVPTAEMSSLWQPVSLSGHATEHAFWFLLPPLVVYIAVIKQDRLRLQKLVYIAIGVGVFQGILGLMQFGQGGESLLYFGNEYGSGSATGTYRNRDHFAGLMEMLFPVALALLAIKIGHTSRVKIGRKNWRQRLNFIASIRGHQSVVFALIAILLVLALIFTKSRMGVALAMIGLLLVLFAFFRRLGGNNVFGAYGTVVSVVIVLAVEIGLAPVLDRFAQDPLNDLRWTIYSTSMQATEDFSPLGSGQGTFPLIYPQCQPQDMNAFVNRAHNDYLEWIFEGGLLALGIIIFLLFLYFRNWKVLWIKESWQTFRFIQVGAGIGVFLILLHSLLDFNLHKPANAIYFAFLLAIFMRHNAEELERKMRRSHSTTERLPHNPIAVKTAPVAAAPDDPDLSDWS